MARVQVRQWWRQWRSTVLVLALLLMARSVVADWYEVPTGSMRPTILEGDRIFVWKAAYQLRLPLTPIRLVSTAAPERGDIVVVANPEGERTPLVKRVVGLPGDLVEMRGDLLFVNGIAQTLELAPVKDDGEEGEPVLAGREVLTGRSHAVRLLPERPALRSFAPVRVPAGEVLLLGDNRDDSRDSRYFGTLPISDLRGRVVGVMWSWREGPRWARFLSPLS